MIFPDPYNIEVQSSNVQSYKGYVNDSKSHIQILQIVYTSTSQMWPTLWKLGTIWVT